MRLRAEGPVASCCLAAFFVLLVGACASVKVYDEGGNEVGIPFYPAKTYLAVETTKEGKKLTLLSVPDVTRPHTIKHEGGWGTAEFNLTLSHGMIATLNPKSDSKIPETISAVGDVLSGAGDLTTPLAAAAGGNTAVRGDVQDLADQMKNEVSDPLAVSADPTIKDIGMRLAGIQATVDAAATVDISSGIAEGLNASNSAIREELAKVKPLAEQLEALAGVEGQESLVVRASTSLRQVVRGLSSLSASAKALVLYEVVEEAGGVGFRRVELP